MTGTQPDTAGALLGAIISAAFALAWALWGASGLAPVVETVVRIVAVLFAVALIGRAAVLRRRNARSTHEGSLYSAAVPFSQQRAKPSALTGLIAATDLFVAGAWTVFSG